MDHIELSCSIRVDAEGYEWRRGTLKPLSGSAGRIYDPFVDEPALFVKFSDIQSDGLKENAINFACQYGAVCKSLKQWAEHSQAMRSLVQLWQAAADVDPHWKNTLLSTSASFALRSAGCRITAGGKLFLDVADPLEIIRLQCALAVAADKQLRYCEWCNTPFLVDPPLTRTTKQFCKRSCAVMASRARKEKHVAPKKRKQSKAKGKGRRRSQKGE